MLEYPLDRLDVSVSELLLEAVVPCVELFAFRGSDFLVLPRRYLGHHELHLLGGMLVDHDPNMVDQAANFLLSVEIVASDREHDRRIRMEPLAQMLLFMGRVQDNFGSSRSIHFMTGAIPFKMNFPVCRT